MVLRSLAIALFCLTFTSAAHAQTRAGYFTDYNEMRSAMDDAMISADITTALLRFDAGVTSAGETLDVQAKFAKLFPNGLPNTALVRRDVYDNDFSRELLVYWNGTKYLWVSILLHDRRTELVAIEFSANTDYDKVAGEF
jgi:hypothetical protein